MGKRVLFVDLDPQCNLTISAMFEDELEEIWKEEDPYMDDYSDAISMHPEHNLFASPRSVHFLLKPVEEGFSDFETLPPAKKWFLKMCIFYRVVCLFINLSRRYPNAGMVYIKENH